jgi:Family of unknown function (DUF5994)
MALRESRAVSGRRQAGPENTPRLRLKRKAPITGYVDGAWWPHTEDLPTELPDLLTVLSVRLGTVARVMYNLDEWAKAPRRMTTGGRTVRLDGYHRQPPNTLEVLDASGNKIVLLVVPAQTDPDLAHSIVMAAAVTDNASSVDSLLMAGKQPF